jgi:RNA polymerase sigma-70 factor, ECF subfamily
MAGFAQILGNISADRPDNVAGRLQGTPTLPEAAGLIGGAAASTAAAPGFQNEPEPSPQDAFQDNSSNRDDYPDLRSYLWGQLVIRLRAGEPAAMEELYTMFSSGVRYYLARQLGAQDLEDRLHDAFVVVVDAIRGGELRDPRRLMGFIRTVVKRMVATTIDRQVHERRGRVDQDRTTLVSAKIYPENAALHHQQVALVREVLAELTERDRQVLTRFYVDEQPAQKICDEMSLTMTQFRLLKSRAKNRFGEIGRKRMKSSFLRKFW